MISLVSSNVNLHLVMGVLMWVLREWIPLSGCWQMSERILSW